MELITVVAIIAILASVLIPTIGRVQINAKKAKTRVQFSQWSAALEAFRQEYGFYPNFDDIPNGVINNAARSQQFIETLTGRTVTGGALPDGAPGLDAGNTKRIQFYSFGADELTSGANPLLQDAFGNTAIVVLMDLNHDGMVRIDDAANGGDYTVAPEVITGAGGPIATGEFVRAGVLFYSAGVGENGGDIVRSW